MPSVPLKDLSPEWRFPDDEGNPRILGFDCPCRCGLRIEVVLKPKVANGWMRSDTLDFEKVSLTPSIAFLGKTGNAEHWHGYITNGQAVWA